ncbi:uncharacterized protein [Aegilops tauschii subsp. strangulata]|uniref:uncharacterized protein n=1 Tax=Aegilops tauschii subsp. strangulata TaxID=200361 RepID=UPI003CC8D8BA
MRFDLSRIIRRIDGLDELLAPFSNEEIDAVVKEMPTDRAPGPDGFNGCFLKSCWQIIKEDFYRMCQDFHGGKLDITSISEGYITLIPKISSPETANDYRPITLLNCYLLQAAINDAFARHLIDLPLPCNHSGDFLVVQYADDTILVMPACPDQSACMETILEDYAASVGLKINFHKSTLIPINIDRQCAIELARVFGCSVGSLPFTYLGLPMGTTRPTLLELMPLVHGVERKMSTALSLMSSGAKLTLVNSTVTLMLIYAMCTIKLHPKVIEHLNKLRRYCLRAKNSEDGVKNNSLAAWELVCRTKRKGGLGVIDIKTQNVALLLKHLFKFYNREEVPG